MKKIVLTAAALLAISGSAFAGGSDHYGSNGANQPAAAVDSSYTASVKKSEPAAQTPAQGSDRNLFGNN
ncbi:MAG: DUF680 domain-containing protein [Mesorhizobium sp.]|uniref:DUF680 domain-containing protein n=1 Tax=unclassified Mesorhizobium TaxID=325217 RepID=UPI000F75D9CF|nr:MULTISPECIES: DUF680 domain-containing protein [unclassified Mesorhizobium]AZO49485.1 DUF680 domain-containing protein [Mesorhizobium sp. M4B.F.Ca.ET.058.02.1.1]RVC43398.1 DUF680 domain-containing protein [Mesorhizobium sp. M4A.F.Ca.ET.090.04.2.1]RWC51331.1 MAG: DUF680 domain-containing protein [Mesorhizobium sp.]RWD05031.1 MAG: DUF680 domain-containing protein [Mesorhizobium sp.]RWD14491.1 MAG: DUF680 domain-containing protein [Mesorhizobium sp.]